MTSFLVVSFFSGCAARPAEDPLNLSLEQVKRQIRVGPAALTAGTARVEITPPVGVPLAGYAKRRGRSSIGIRDPLFVRALAMSDGQDTLVLISADLLVFPHPLAEELAGEISARLAIPRQAVILTTTHTHSGAGAYAHGFLHEQVFGPLDSKVLEGIRARVLWAAQQAAQKQEPVRWAGSVEEKGLDGFLENRADPAGPTDPALGVLLLETAEGRVKAVVVSAAAHPTLLDSNVMRLSADFPGEVCRRIESDYAGSTCLFVNGAAGDVRPWGGIGENPEEQVSRFGALLAEAVEGQVSRTAPSGEGDLAAWGRLTHLPEPQIRLGPIPLPEGGDLEDIPIG